MEDTRVAIDVRVCVAAFFIGCGLTAQTAAIEVRGQAVTADGKPVRGATITVGESSATTVDDGGFLIRLERPGSYPLTTSLPGYVVAEDTSKAITVTGEGAPKLTIVFLRTASIEVVVEDQNGAPVKDATVELILRRSLAGQRVASRIKSGRTNEAGVARFADVKPETYFLFVPRRTSDFAATTPACVVGTFYPSDEEFEGASPIYVRPGLEMGGLRIRLRESQCFEVSGRVQGANVTAVELHSTGATGGSVPMMADLDPPPAADVRPDGTFHLSRVPRGSYVAIATRGATVRGTVPVQVSNRNLDGVEIRVDGAASISGRVKVGDQPAKGASLALGAFGTSGPQFIALHVDDEGLFQASNIPLGEFRVMIPKLVIHRVEIDGKGSAGSKFEILSAGPHQMTIQIERQGSSINGRLDAVSASSTSGTATISAVPTTPLEGGMLQLARFDDRGGFEFKNLEPGKYRVCAWAETGDKMVEVLLQPDRETELERRCESLEVDGRETKAVSVKRISIADFK